MIFRDFRFNIIFRVLILLALVVSAGIAFYLKYFVLCGLASILMAISIANLFHYVFQTNRDLAYFLSSVKYDDFTANFHSNSIGAAFEDLHDGFTMIKRKFQNIRAEKEANHLFLQAIVKQVNVGLLAINEQEEVILMNETFQSLFHKSYLINLSGLKKIDERLLETVQKLKPGHRELLKIQIQNKILHLSIQSVEIKLQQKQFRIFSFQDIQAELDNQEFMAWQKLIRILTHEIMNSVAPITSLSGTILNIIQQSEQPDPAQMENIRKSIAVIEKRSQGLLNFTETYRSLTKIPPPRFELIDPKTILEEAEILMENSLRNHQVKFEKNIREEGVTFQGDAQLLQQVLINLIKNAIDAVKDRPNPLITASVFRTGNFKTCIQIADNGVGIAPDNLDQIFVPFYTTKKDGSGIGLSLSRQIMRLHKGSIELQSKLNEGTIVNLWL